MVIPDPAAYVVQWKTFVANVSLTDGLVYELAVQRLDEPIFVLLVILVIVADEHFVSGNLVDGHNSYFARKVSDGITSCQARIIVTTTRG